MARYRMLLSYDGTDFCGWQKQKDHHEFSPEKPSLQETVETALSTILNHPLSIVASGRTDAGVHASGQVIHFDSDRKMPRDLCWALKGKLPPSISAKALWLAPHDFHALHSAVRKTYRYWIWNHPRAPALLHRYSWWLRNPLDLDFLNEAAGQLRGEKDFSSFRSTGTEVLHSVRRIDRAEWSLRRPGLIEFRITGGGFMKQMVRNIVGTMVELEMKGKSAKMMSEIIELKDRQAAGLAAPAQGLFLRQVSYPKSLDNKCTEI